MGIQIRLSIDKYFMDIANVVSSRSTCLRLAVGAIIVKDKQIIATGYNGAPKGLPHCLDIGCIRNNKKILSGTMIEYCRAVHAEQNAIIQAGIHGVSIKDSTIYCTHQPCVLCAKMIINARIKKVVYQNSYSDKRALKFMKEAKVDVKQIK